MPKLCAIPEDVKQLANSAEMEVVEDINGRYIIRSASDKAQVGAFNYVDEAREALQNLFTKNAVDLDAGLPVTMKAEVTRAQRPKIQDTLRPGRFKKLQAGILSRVTPQGKWMEALEDIGHGKPFRNIYRPTQAALNAADREMATVLREGLGGKTKRFGEKGARKGRSFNQAIEGDLNKSVTNLKDKEQARLITLKREALTKEELERPGVLLSEGMNSESIGAADRFAELGVADQIPVLLRTNEIIEIGVRDTDDLLRNKLPALENEITRGRISEELLPAIQRARIAAEEMRTRDEFIEAMGLSENEVVALNMLKTFSENPNYNIPAIYRHATAPRLEKGFKNGQEMFVAKRGVTPQARAVDQERWRILEEAFEGSGYDPAQVLGAQLPILRKFAEAGIFPARGRNNANALAKQLSEALPEGDAVLTRRVLSGQNNPHELDPVVTAFKHTRNMILRKTLDPVLPAALEEARHVARINKTAGRFIVDYLNEIEGLPIESWQRLNESFQTTMRLIGVNVHSRSAEQVTNLLMKLAYGASIPLRPALVARNYMQSLFMTSPIVGPKSWWESTKYVSNPKYMRQALDDAIQAGAIDPDVTPVFGATEIMGIETTRLSRFFGGGQVTRHVDNLFKAGFSVYRSADDWGRAIAFDAGRKKVRSGVKEYIESAGNVADMTRLKKKARVNHFSDSIQEEFEELVRNGHWTDAENLIGKNLADKTHFLYGNSNHPTGWGGVAGRMFGQFGTFPVQYFSYMMETTGQLLKGGHHAEFAEFLAVHGGINAGVIYAGANVMDADLSSWATFPSLTYTGGPYMDVFLNLAAAAGGSDAERGIALSSLKRSLFPSFEDPESIFIPGSYFVGDLVEAMNARNSLEALGAGAGIRFMNPGEEDIVTKGLSWIEEMIPD